MMFQEYNDVITVDELCEILIIGKNAAYELLSTGAIKAFRNGSRWKIPKEAVERYIREGAGI